MDTGRIDPRVGSGRVRILEKFGRSGLVEVSENALCEFYSFVVFLIEIVMKKCYISTLVKLQ